MNTLETPGQSVGFEIRNDLGEIYNENDCPWHVRVPIERAIERGRQDGSVIGNGMFWRWERSVILEIEDQGTVLDRFAIPWAGWEAFKLCADRRQVDARDWLAVILGDALSRDVSIKKMIALLFPRQSSPEIERFEARQAVWHGTEVA
ncbi:MAG TPA: hypothetical protein VIS96_03700 [Terrimicrobiaceae bacterium]